MHWARLCYFYHNRALLNRRRLGTITQITPLSCPATPPYRCIAYFKTRPKTAFSRGVSLSSFVLYTYGVHVFLRSAGSVRSVDTHIQHIPFVAKITTAKQDPSPRVWTCRCEKCNTSRMIRYKKCESCRMIRYEKCCSALGNYGTIRAKSWRKYVP